MTSGRVSKCEIIMKVMGVLWNVMRSKLVQICTRFEATCCHHCQVLQVTPKVSKYVALPVSYSRRLDPRGFRREIIKCNRKC